MEEDNGKKEVEDGSSVSGGSGFCDPCSWMNFFITSFLSCFGLLDHHNDSKDLEIGARNINVSTLSLSLPLCVCVYINISFWFDGIYIYMILIQAMMVTRKRPTKPPPSPGSGGKINKVL